MKFQANIFSFLFILSYFCGTINAQGETCYTPSYTSGVCVVLPQCPKLVQWYGQNAGNQQVISYLVGSQRSCGTRSVGRNPLVCCDAPVSYQVPNQQTQPTQPPVQTTRPTSPTLAPSGNEPWAQPPQTPATTLIRRTTTTTPIPPTTQANRSNIQRCVDPKGEPGICISIRDCPGIRENFVSRQRDNEYVQYIRQSNAICNYIQPNICCPQNDNQDVVDKPRSEGVIQGELLTPESGCGFSNVTHTRIVGGKPAKKGAWPWMALIGYTDNFKQVGWKCGGSLITTRHILTAAHCLKSTLTTVRLGEHDIGRTDESEIQEFRVVKVAKYPNYDPRDGNSDLAILYLDHDAAIVDNVRPICLPLEPESENSYEGTSPFVAGWGRLAEGGKASNILQELQLPVLGNKVCEDRYKKQGKLIDAKQFNEAVLCAGDLNGGHDSCQGDSGGPLVSPKILSDTVRYYQIGIVSYGIGCARQDVPGVYTRVSTFIDWIKQKIHE